MVGKAFPKEGTNWHKEKSLVVCGIPITDRNVRKDRAE